MEGSCAGWDRETGEVDRGDEGGKSMDRVLLNIQFPGLAIGWPPVLLETTLPPP